MIIFLEQKSVIAAHHQRAQLLSKTEHYGENITRTTAIYAPCVPTDGPRQYYQNTDRNLPPARLE